MHQLIAWCGFLGGWLLVAGPVYQAVLELDSEEVEWDRVRARMRELPSPAPVSVWWWLVPPVRILMERRRRATWHDTLLGSLDDAEFEALMVFANKAVGWWLVGIGGLLIAVKESWALVEENEWPSWLLAVLLVVGVALATAGRRTWGRLADLR